MSRGWFLIETNATRREKNRYFNHATIDFSKDSLETKMLLNHTNDKIHIRQKLLKKLQMT